MPGLPMKITLIKKRDLKKTEAAYAGIRLETDMANAVTDADLVIESMAENEKDKIAFYEKLCTASSGKDCDCHKFVYTASVNVCKVHR